MKGLDIAPFARPASPPGELWFDEETRELESLVVEGWRAFDPSTRDVDTTGRSGDIHIQASCGQR